MGPKVDRKSSPPPPGRNLSQYLGVPATLASAPELDPALLALAGASGASAQPTPLDPALFAIEQVVHDVQRGRIGPDDLSLPAGIASSSKDATSQHTQERTDTEAEAAHHALDTEADAHMNVDSTHIPLDDDGIDPALREIVNSLTNAQQSHHTLGDPDERERLDRERLQHTIQSTLEDFAQGSFGNYGAIFNTNFPQSPNNHNLILPPLGAESDSHPHSHAHTPLPGSSHDVGGDPGSDSGVPVKRGRGRPKGSKNKPKPGAIPPPPRVPPPPRRKGRPPKERSAEELAEFERRKEEKALGIKRKRGRPRKYPELGLVREMRLKKNRESVQEKIRLLEERARIAAAAAEVDRQTSLEEHAAQLEPQPEDGAGALSASDVALGEQVAAAVARGHEGSDPYPWSYQDGQSLLDVVGAVSMDQRQMDVSMAIEGASQHDDMRGVFALAEVGGAVHDVDEQE